MGKDIRLIPFPVLPGHPDGEFFDEAAPRLDHVAAASYSSSGWAAAAVSRADLHLKRAVRGLDGLGPAPGRNPLSQASLHLPQGGGVGEQPGQQPFLGGRRQ